MYDQLSLATTSHKRPTIENTKIFPVKALQLEPPVNDLLLYKLRPLFGPDG